jgi:hypothetical protein
VSGAPSTVGEVIDARVEAGRVLLLWPGPGGTWLGEDEDYSVWRFPAELGGWADRKPAMRPCAGSGYQASTVAIHNALGTGWPGLTMPQ